MTYTYNLGNFVAFLFQITPLTSIFEYSGNQNGNETLHHAIQSLLISYSNEVT